MKITLNQKEVDLLFKATMQSKHPINLELSLKNGGKQELEASEDTLIELRDQCLDYLMMVGFNEKYEPTKEGNVLETLIDKLYTG